MPRSNCLFRISAFAVALLALASAGRTASAQDAKKTADEANAKLADLQKKLATGKDADSKDNPSLKRLRVDKFEADDDQLKVIGVFLDPGTEPGVSGYSAAFESVQNDLRKLIGAGNIKFNWNGITEVGAIDKDKNPKAKFTLPHIALQNIANAAGAKSKHGDKNDADRIYLNDSVFGPGGELILSGFREDNTAVESWLTGDGAKALAEAKHPAVRVKDSKPQITFTTAKVKPWPVTATDIQKLFAASKDVATRKLRADRAYFAYEGTEVKFTVAGVGIGEDKRDEIALQDLVRALWPDVLGGTKPVRLTLGFGAGLVEPIADFRAAIVERPALDGVRVDPGAEFGPTGEFMFAGLQPGLNAEQKKELNDVYLGVLKTIIAKGGAADRYKQLESSPIAVERMKPIPVKNLKEDLRAWAIQNKDDVRLRRVYFLDDVKPIAQKYYTVAKDGGGLVLVFQVADANDLKAVDAEFAKLFAKHFPAGIPEATLSEKRPLPEGSGEEKNKEPLLPGLTGEIRKIMASDQKKWYGVLIERGYFDEKDRYSIAGVVDAKEQNDELAKLMDQLKADAKWTEYFNPTPNPPALTVIPMAEMLNRVKRVTPAYSVFDGVRIESARYDEKSNLVFDAHIVGQIDPDATPLLAKLLRDHPTYKRRAPADKLVRVVQVSGPAYSDDQVANFSLGYGAELLAKGEMAKAKAWLDVGLLHYPNVSAVWFLSAYYNHLKDDPELVARDLQRVIELEGTLQFNGPSQRKRRYETAKDLQGTKRIALEDIWLIRFREVKDGAKPITLMPPK
jgi:hypothetical protein